MALKYGIPPGNPTVVWDDVPGVAGSATNDPYVSWQYHLNRTDQKRGGVDMTARWAPLCAPIDCRVEHYGGGAGTAVRMWAADNSGWSDVFDHMSTIDVPNNAIVPFGGRVGTSGDTGAPGAPHLHWHRLDPSGARKIPWDYFTDGTPTPTPKDEDMAQGAFYRIATGQGTGEIYFQAEPNTPLLKLDSDQWYGYAVNGNKFNNTDAQNVQALWRRCGLYVLEPSYGRKVVAAAGEQSFDGYKIWLPGL